MALLAFAQDAQRAIDGVVVVEVEVSDLLAAQTAGVGDGDEGGVAQTVDTLLR